MSEQKYLPGIVTGYKATDSDMKCRGLQYVLGEWQEVKEGDIIKCGENGLHFCPHLPGPWNFYSRKEGARLFRCEAEYVLDEHVPPGAGTKMVARRVRLVEEIHHFDDKSNRGASNTGAQNHGFSNTGDLNVGYWNAGDRNIGKYNSGTGNTGCWNTGDGNLGDQNTGDRNKGKRNTGTENIGNKNSGNNNIGSRNTGFGNIGNDNSGSGNATSGSAGFFNTEPQTVKCFDVETGLTFDQLLANYPDIPTLAEMLGQDYGIRYEAFAKIPGITPEKLTNLHNKFIEARKAKQ